MWRGTGERAATSWRTALLVLVAGVFAFAGAASGFEVRVVDAQGNPVNGFRWLLEEDTTNITVPGALVANSISLDIHSSYAPVVTKGHEGASSVAITPPDSTKPYFVSVLPDGGHAMSGTTIRANAGPGDVFTVRVNAFPIPTAQISVLVFKDHFPINNAPDLPNETGLQGFELFVFDYGGRVSQDAFGNPLGTTYNPDGTVAALGSGRLLTDANGEALIKYLAPGKYGIRAVPPPGDNANWVQTATIEGTPGIDAWVQANEPPTFVEGFGIGFYHAFIGFVEPASLPWAVSPPVGGGTFTGVNRFNHFDRPSVGNQGFFVGPPVAECWVGLNDPVTGEGLYAAPCAGDSSFSIPNVPPGTYQLVTWDRPLDALFGFNTVTMPTPATTVNLGDVLSFRWFGTLFGTVFNDLNENGFRDPGEAGIPEQAVNIRFRDGSMYQGTVTDISGEYGFSEVFPFFKWLVTEVDFARFKATGATMAVDYGGLIPAPDPTDEWLIPSFDALKPQPQFCSQEDVDGGIDGCTVVGNPRINPNTGNNLSRTETGPVLTQAMMLFLNQTNVMDWGKKAYVGTENGGISGIVYYASTRAEDDPRYAGAEPWEPGIPRVQVNLYRDSNRDGIIDDINAPAGVQLADVDNYPFGDFPGLGDVDRNGNTLFDLGDALRVTATDSWDDNKPSGCVQDLPGGGFIHGQPVTECFDNYATWNQLRPGVFDGGYAFGPAAGEADLPAGTYLVEAVAPPGYELVKEEDKNVDFGEEYAPGLLALPPLCVGDPHLVPAELSLFPGVAGAYAGQTRPLCDRKQIRLTARQNAAVDFFFFTEVPKAARVVGFVNNDLTPEFNAFSPIFGEKAAPAWIPAAVKDWAGNELLRIYVDEFGAYNAMLPSSFTNNLPMPSGVSPNMLTLVLNDPFMTDPVTGQKVRDPWYDPNYSVTPWTLDYMPGKTTYLDTPLVPVAAFTNNPGGSLDAAPRAGTPVIDIVEATSYPAPLACGPGETVTILSAGVAAQVPNPDYPAAPGASRLTTRDLSFGAVPGTVTVGGVALAIGTWSPDTIAATVPAGLATGQLVVTRGDNGVSSEVGVTFTVADCTVPDSIHLVTTGGSIQGVIDGGTVSAGDIVLVETGTYSENVILYKEIRLQGSGAKTIINGNPNPASRLAAWHADILAILGADPFAANEAPGIMVLGNAPGWAFTGAGSRIDGLNVTGSLAGGGIYVNSDAGSLQISNNTVQGNQGNYGGGITVGTPFVASNNPNVTIRHNRVATNGGIQGGGGIVVYTGADNYQITDNVIIGNFSRFDGAGIEHFGLSDGGRITRNRILFNEVFFNTPGAIGDGGGIFVGEELAGTGSGSVTIEANLIQGNLAGGGSGAGIRARGMGAADVLDITNNMIVNNVAGYAGGGIALAGSPNVNIVHNTIAHNDSTATAAAALPPGLAVPGAASTPQGAGIVSDSTTPVLVNNILWHNRSWFTLIPGTGPLQPNPTMPYWDLQVPGISGGMNPQNCILSSLTYADGSNYTGNGNLASDPQFVAGYLNSLVSAAVLDEGGNFISVRFSPLTQAGNYHIVGSSPARNSGTATGVVADFDGDARSAPDIGADEYVAVNGLVLNAVPASPQLHTTVVTFTANASGGTGQLEYRFLKRVPGGTIFVEMQPFSADNTWAWSTTAADAGTSRIVAQVRSAGTTLVNGEAQVGVNYTIYGPASGVTLAALPPSPRLAGTQVTFTAAGQGGSGTYQYRFLKRVPGGTTFVEVQPYSITNTWVWNTTAADVGASRIVVQVRNLGSTVAMEAQAGVNYTINLPASTGVTLGATPASPSTAPVSVTFLAAGQGGTGFYEYRFLRRAPGALTFTEVQPYSTNSSWVWSATAADVGVSRVAVQVRTLGSTVAMDAQTAVNYRVDP